LQCTAAGAAAARIYQLVDHFSLFYLNHMDGRSRHDAQFWQSRQKDRGYFNWAGYAFELLCLTHVEKIRAALGVAGVSTRIAAWRSAKSDRRLQIDLVLDRNDGVMDLCEMKYTLGEFVIDKEYAQRLIERRYAFANETRTRKALHVVFATANGLKQNAYSHLSQADVTLVDLFA